MLGLFAWRSQSGPRCTLSVPDELPSSDTRVLIVDVLVTSVEAGRDRAVTIHPATLLAVSFFIATVLMRIVVYGLISQLRRKGRLHQRELIVGAVVVGATVARHLQGHPELGETPVGFFDD